MLFPSCCHGALDTMGRSIMAASKEETPWWVTFFENIDDPRRSNANLRHDLLDVIVIAVAGMICGADDWAAIEVFGNAKKKWFETFLELPNGIPSHDTFGRVFARIDPEQFRTAFGEAVATLAKDVRVKTIAVDGKTARRSHDRGKGRSALHVVSAWASENQTVLGQVATEEKSNEITAIPLLLRALDLKGAIVTLDAMGCQKQIAAQIVDQGGAYVITVKANQTKLHEDIDHYYQACLQDRGEFEDTWQTWVSEDEGHGRKDRRRYHVSKDLSDLRTHQDWKGMKAVGVVEYDRHLDGVVKTERRYYILSRKLTPKQFAEHVRKHWEIENKLHWVLDMAYREDESRVRTGNAQENLVMLRHLTLNLLREDKTKKLGIKNKRLAAGWDHVYLLLLLQGMVA